MEGKKFLKSNFEKYGFAVCLEAFNLMLPPGRYAVAASCMGSLLKTFSINQC